MTWQVPKELPDLRRVGIVALDTETNDEGLRADRGSAWPWRDGHICGISVAYRADGDIRAHYFPLRHPDSDNFDPAQVYRWLKDLIASDVRIVTQNGFYDWGWLRADGGIVMPPSDRLEEIGALATLDRREPVQLQPRRAVRALRPARQGRDAAAAGGRGRGLQDQQEEPAQAHIWQLPARYVGPYAEADAANTLALFEKLDPILDREGTRDAYRLEVDLLPMVLRCAAAAFASIRAPPSRRASYCLQKRDRRARRAVGAARHAASAWHEIDVAKWKARTFDAHASTIRARTKGNPSFTAGKLGWMAQHEHWLPQLIATASKYDARRQHISRRAHPRAPHQRAHPCRNPPVPLGRRRRTLVALLLFQSAAAADAVARQGAGAAHPRRVPAGRRRGVVQARHLAAGIPLRRAPRRAAQSAGRQGSRRALPQQSRRRLSRHRRRDDRPRSRHGEGRQLRQDLRRRRRRNSPR